MRATSGLWRAFALAAGFWMASTPVGASTGDEPAAPPTKPAPEVVLPPTSANPPAPAAHAKIDKIELKLVIAGLSGEGCEVEVKPGNPRIDFKPQTLRVPSSGRASVTLKDIELRGADRNCAFAVVVREKDQDPKTIYRGFRLPAESSAKRAGALSFTCFLSSASRIAELERADGPVRR